MYSSNSGAPRNGFYANNQVSTFRRPDGFWPPPSQPDFYQPPQDAHHFSGAPQRFANDINIPNQSFREHPPPFNGITDQELTALISKYQLVKRHIDKPPKLNVSTIAQLFSEFKHLLQNVESSVKYLEVTKKTLSEEDWVVKCQELDKKKGLLLEIDKQLSDPAFQTLVQKTVHRVKAKRSRLKRKKDAWRQKKKEIQEVREDKHKKIDLWLEKMKDEVERARRAEMVKKEADLVLSEVTLKKTEAKRILGLLNSLTKLRNAKLLQLSTNQRVSEEETKSFNLVIDKLKTMWAKQLKEYNMEEQGLKVMLNDAELERVNTEEKTWRLYLHQWTEALFGERRTFDPLQAQPSDWDTFLSVRKDWDQFVAEDSLLSSSIPSGWVVPVNPSSVNWSLFLAKK